MARTSKQGTPVDRNAKVLQAVRYAEDYTRAPSRFEK